jgi:D-beta-D-heptose 7-phosphate kinase/D-beta-D-heptose 1-phosphate adenosyltransferase
MTDSVIIFEEDTPLELIKAIMPDILVKGGDYTVETDRRRKRSDRKWRRGKAARIVEGISTTGIIEKLKGHS